MKVEVIKPARLNGGDIEVGGIVELDNQLASNWIRLGLAKPTKDNSSSVKPKDGDIDGNKVNNSTKSGTSKSNRSKKSSEN